MKVSKKNIEKWCIALRSGKYKQTTYKLQNENGFCCLGVACKIFIPEEKQDLKNGQLTGSYPDRQPYSPKWLNGISEDVNYKTGEGLLTLNDLMGLTFDEIADVLELIYIHEAI
jgi:hypothetical protein